MGFYVLQWNGPSVEHDDIYYLTCMYCRNIEITRLAIQLSIAIVRSPGTKGYACTNDSSKRRLDVYGTIYMYCYLALFQRAYIPLMLWKGNITHVNYTIWMWNVVPIVLSIR